MATFFTRRVFIKSLYIIEVLPNGTYLDLTHKIVRYNSQNILCAIYSWGQKHTEIKGDTASSSWVLNLELAIDGKEDQRTVC